MRSIYEPEIQQMIADWSFKLSEIIGEQIILEPKIPEPITPDYILKHVCDMLGLDVGFVKGKSRKKEAVEAYQISAVMIRDRFHPSLKEIAKAVKNIPVDHSSIIFRLQQHDDWMETDPTYRSKFNLCRI